MNNLKTKNMDSKKPRKLLSAKSVSIKMDCGVSTVYQWVKDGRLPKPIDYGNGDTPHHKWLESEIDEIIEQKIKEREKKSETSATDCVIGSLTTVGSLRRVDNG